MLPDAKSRSRRIAGTVCHALLAPSPLAVMLFVLLFSGPPKFRYRDPLASLYGEVDFAIVANVAVWIIAGFWVAYQIWLIYAGQRPRLKFWFGHKVALGVIFLLAASTLVSLSAPVTAFKVYQVLVEFLFTVIFIEWYGIERCLDLMLTTCILLGCAIAVAAALAPDLVLEASESGFPRLRGQGIADTGIVATFAIILLFCRRRAIAKPFFLMLTAFCGALLFFSLERNAWLTVCVFFTITLLKKPKIATMRWIYLFWIVAAVALALGLGSWMIELRDTESLYTLSARTGLWAYFIAETLSTSPWLGLGYVAGARDLGMNYEYQLGSGHSIFFDVFVGGGLLSLTVFLLLFIQLSFMAYKLLRRRPDAVSFAVCSLFLAVLIPGLVGGDIDTSPSGFTFWSLVTILPLIAAVNTDALTNSEPRVLVGHRLPTTARNTI
jgi:hypothetical protein